MTRDARRILAAAVLAGILLAAGPVLAAETPTVAVDLQGGTYCSGDALSADVQVEFLGPHELLVRVTNDSPAADCGEGPYLQLLGFNLADGPAWRCLATEDGAPFALRWGGSVCPSSWRWWENRFDYRLVERIPYSRGLEAGESVEFILRVRPDCQAGFSLQPEDFADADQSVSGGHWAQWAARFVSGPFWRCGGVCTNGCASGDAVLVEPEPQAEPYDWVWLLATALEVHGTPSLLADPDPRAGSALLAFNGGLGFDGVYTDPPYGVVEATLRNGAGAVVEQSQWNRRWPPSALDPDGCALDAAWQCWFWPEGGDTEIVATVPDRSTGSNEGFDDGDDRVEVGAEAVIDLTVADPVDATHETARFWWTDPDGLDTDGLLLRVLCNPVYDFPILRIGYEDGGRFVAPFIDVLVETPTELYVEMNVWDAISYCQAMAGETVLTH